MKNKIDRVTKIKRKYGEHAFEKWGKGTSSHPGGIPILRAFKEGRLVYKR